MSPSEAHELYESPTLRRCLLALEEERTQEMGNIFFMWVPFSVFLPLSHSRR